MKKTLYIGYHNKQPADYILASYCIYYDCIGGLLKFCSPTSTIYVYKIFYKNCTQLMKNSSLPKKYKEYIASEAKIDKLVKTLSYKDKK